MGDLVNSLYDQMPKKVSDKKDKRWSERMIITEDGTQCAGGMSFPLWPVVWEDNSYVIDRVVSEFEVNLS